jgi:hypothetical protein
MRISLWSSIGVAALLFGFASTASAKDQDKSWEVDLYDDEADVTYVDDGYDDVHVYDHNDHYNDRSYIAVEEPDYGYQDSYGYQDGYGYQNSGVSVRYETGRYGHGGYGYNDGGRAYVPRHYRPTRYQLRYHNRYRGW